MEGLLMIYDPENIEPVEVDLEYEPLASKDNPDLMDYPCPDGLDPDIWAEQDIGFKKGYYVMLRLTAERTGEK